MNRKLLISIALVAFGAAAAGGVAYAAADGEAGNDAIVDIARAKIGIAEANKVLDVEVDATDGKILSSRADGRDRGERDERD